MSLAIETRQLAYRAGSFHIPGLDLRVPVGSIYGFLGPNGSGKTTTIRLLLGLLRPRAGTISVLDRPVPRDLPAVLARVGFVPEQPHFDLRLTVEEILRFQAAFYPTWDHAAADELLGRFDLAPAQPFGRLSKGQRAKVMMLAALAQRPELLVLDEPTDGLDPVARRDILASLLDYVSERGATVFVSSHLVHELERVCDWIGVMDEGRLVLECPMAEFKEGTKRIRVIPLPEADRGALPIVPLRRLEGTGNGETWVVRGWTPAMAAALQARGVAVTAVDDVDLEDGFVELLSAFRAGRGR